jgi:hypothetical protein
MCWWGGEIDSGGDGLGVRLSLDILASLIDRYEDELCRLALFAPVETMK